TFVSTIETAAQDWPLMFSRADPSPAVAAVRTSSRQQSGPPYTFPAWPMGKSARERCCDRRRRLDIAALRRGPGCNEGPKGNDASPAHSQASAAVAPDKPGC